MAEADRRGDGRSDSDGLKDASPHPGLVLDLDAPEEAMADEVRPNSAIAERPGAASREAKGKARAADTDAPALPSLSRFVTLPPELIDRILEYLSPTDLTRASATCRVLYARAIADYLWQPHVQDNVPGQHISSSYPFATFRELYRAHDPRWFLPKHKIWFSDAGLPGRLLVARYDQRRGCIEGYQLVANNRDDSAEVWLANPAITIFAFDPEVKLHLDLPILRLPADPRNDPYAAELENNVVTFKLRGRGGFTPAQQDTDTNPGASSSSTTTTTTQPAAPSPETQPPHHHFQPELLMRVSTIGHLQNSFIHARHLDPADLTPRLAAAFPHRYAWPPPIIPSAHRVLGAGLVASPALRPTDLARARAEVCPTAFRIRKWIEMRVLRGGYIQFGADGSPREFNPWADVVGGGQGGDEQQQQQQQHGVELNRSLDLEGGVEGGGVGEGRPVHIGEEVSTYATLDPALYTPTPRRPFRGIWVGHYGGHGCEFLWVNQPDCDEVDDGSGEESLRRLDDESDGDFARRRRDAAVYRGQLEAVKLTGDANVPRGEYSWVADDLGAGGFVRVEDKAPFEGARVVRSRGHIAHTGFVADTYVDSELILVSPDRLAQNWVSMDHISYYHRVNIDDFLVPR